MASLVLTAAAMPGAARASDPPPDLPPVGRSQFDYLIGVNPVPFPFSRLVQHIETQLEKGSAFSPVKTTLIPLGRSLQRAASAPDFFRFPRVVLAVDGDAKPGGLPLKDRLFIGYNEKAAVLEVISYNEQAGRFEFQVVHDYRQGSRPQVSYVRRDVCLACHQNNAPIFARPLWDETPANAAIAARLKAVKRDDYGLKVTGTDIAYFIDAAAARANLLPVWQDVWREGCGPGAQGAPCRRALFLGALRYGLAGVLPGDAALKSLAQGLDARWAQVWPKGMAIPNSSIPNRDPLAFVPEAAGLNEPQRLAPELMQLAHVPAYFEPLRLRPPREVWREVDSARLMVGLAGLLDRADLRRLDEGLKTEPAAEQRTQLACKFTRKAGGQRMAFSCSGAGVKLAGVWQVSRKIVSGSVEQISLPDAVAPAAIELEGRAPHGQAVAFALRQDGLRARLADGRALERVEFVLDHESAGSATLTLRDDFSRVDAQVARLAADDKPFHAREWMAQLLPALGIAYPVPALAKLPAPQVQTQAQTGDRPGIQASFQRFCGQCHDTGERFPPNFMHGSGTAVSSQIDQCAERIFYRLSMWSVDEAKRGKTPMPPVAALAVHGFGANTWARAPELAQLRSYVEQRLASAGNPQRLLSRSFENLRACLPPQGR